MVCETMVAIICTTMMPISSSLLHVPFEVKNLNFLTSLIYDLRQIYKFLKQWRLDLALTAHVARANNYWNFSLNKIRKHEGGILLNISNKNKIHIQFNFPQEIQFIFEISNNRNFKFLCKLNQNQQIWVYFVQFSIFKYH